MILTVSLNPAIDRTCELDELMTGQVNRLKKSVAVAGGKGINVTKVLRRFGMPVMAMGFLGGSNGSLIENAVNDMGADCTFTRTSAETRMNTNVITKDGSVTEILEPGAAVTEEEICTFLSQYEAMLGEAEIVVLSGSLPTGVREDFYAELIRLAHEAGSFVILDSSKEALKEALKAGPDCIKPNKKELETLTEKEFAGEEEIGRAAKDLMKQGIKYVVVSMGEKGLLFISEKETIKAVPPKVTAVNTVGCGDCVVAALAMGFFTKKETEEIAVQAAAVSAANATTLENGDIPMKLLRELRNQVVVRTL